MRIVLQLREMSERDRSPLGGRLGIPATVERKRRRNHTDDQAECRSLVLMLTFVRYPPQVGWS